MTKVTKLVTKAALRVIDLNMIGVDPGYQRQVRSGHKKIVSDFCEEALGIPLIAEREDGSLWVVDGLQRITALLKLGKKTVRAEVFASQGQKHEAEIFAIVNGNRTKLTGGELFQSRLIAGDPIALEVIDIIKKNGFRYINRGGRGGRHTDDSKEISCSSTMYRVVALRGADHLDFALRMIKAAWDGDASANREVIVEGLAEFYKDMEESVDEERLTLNLRRNPPHKIIYSAGLGVGGRVQNMVAQFTKVYRQKVRRS